MSDDRVFLVYNDDFDVVLFTCFGYLEASDVCEEWDIPKSQIVLFK